MDRSATQITVHESAFPEANRERIAAALGRREIDPALLYGGLGQTLRWTKLHQTFSPAKKDASCAVIYGEAFQRLAKVCRGNVAHVVSLACGDGTKDTRCLERLRGAERAVLYTPADLSVEMVLTAERTATAALRGLQTTPLVCDLPNCSALPALLKSFDPSGTERIILFLGTLHNFWPPEVLRSILYGLRSQDHLLLSANLAPAERYDEALATIHAQYDNALTRDWLLGALAELTIHPDDGELSFSLAPADALPGLKRIQADFLFAKKKELEFSGTRFFFEAGEKLRVFYSYRFTTDHVRTFLSDARLKVSDEWIAPSREEGLFLCSRAG